MAYPDPRMSTTAPVNRSVVTLIVFFMGMVFALLTFSPAVRADELAPAVPGSIAGVVKTADGAPQGKITVSLFQPSPNSAGYWRIVRTITTGADGHYRFTLLPPGIYRVGVSDDQRDFAPLYYPTASTIEKATDLIVAGNQQSGVDFVLQPGGQITGTISATERFTITSSTVQLWQAVERRGVVTWESIWPSISLPASGGAYQFTGLGANTYRVCAYGMSMNETNTECYDNVYDLAQATTLTLTVGATISDIHIVLGDGADFAQLSGQVTTAAGQPLAAIQVGVVQAPHEGPPTLHAGASLAPLLSTSAMPAQARGYGVAWTTTDAQGNYDLTTIPAGRYYLYITDPAGNYAAEYYNNVFVPENAQVIEVAPKQVLTALNVQLTLGNHLHGTATLFDQPAAGGFVMVERQTDRGWQVTMSSAVDPITGHYALDGLPDGSYRVSAYVFINNDQASYYYQGYFGGSSLETATAIALAGGETQVADLVLTGQTQFSGAITGHITAHGVPVVGAKVALYAQGFACCMPSMSLPTFQPLIYTFTDQEGRYIINGLATGNVHLGVTDPTGLYATTYYTAHVIPMISNEIALVDTQTRTGIDVDLPIAGALSGRVTRRTGEPVAGLQVSTYHRFDNQFFGLYQVISVDTYTATDGRYTVKGLHAGAYYICFTLGDYTECYGAPDRAYPGNFNSSYRQVNVVAGQTTPNIDLLWGPDLTYYLPTIAR